MTRAPRLADVVAGRDNNVQAIRFAAATAVILFHCFALTNRWQDEPLARFVPQTNSGLLGVQVFFVLSGFLVTQSWVAHPTLRAFATARVLRIYPALIAATLFTIVIAGASSTLPWRDYLADPQTRRFLWRTATGYDVTDGLPGVFMTNPFAHAANGSLWTLVVELRLYIGLAIAGVAGLLTRSTRFAAVVAVVTIAYNVMPWPLPLPRVFDNASVHNLVLLFALGALAYVARAVLPLSIAAALAGVALYTWNPGGYVRYLLLPPILVYAVLVAAYHPRLRVRGATRIGDYSYGLYVYAFPIQQTLVRDLYPIGPYALFALALPVTAIFAAMSWHWLERPALALKSRFRHTQESPP